MRPLSLAERAAIPAGLLKALNGCDVCLVPKHHPVSWLARLIGRGPQIVVRGQNLFWPGLPDNLSQYPVALSVLCHELVHVWQYQNGMTLWRYIIRERGRYRYRLEAGKAYADYGYEQQATMVEDWVRLQHGLTARWCQHAVAQDQLADIIPFA
ncbi:MAG: hypothetical protein WBQ60_00365 [Asticcacaulis sp.]